MRSPDSRLTHLFVDINHFFLLLPLPLPPLRIPQTARHGWIFFTYLESQTGLDLLRVLCHPCAAYPRYGLSWKVCALLTSTLVDTYPFLPSFLQADFIFQLRQFYVDTYNDKFFQGTPAPWFSVFNWMELLYHAPLSLWAIGALLRGGWYSEWQSDD